MSLVVNDRLNHNARVLNAEVNRIRKSADDRSSGVLVDNGVNRRIARNPRECLFKTTEEFQSQSSFFLFVPNVDLIHFSDRFDAELHFPNLAVPLRIRAFASSHDTPSSGLASPSASRSSRIFLCQSGISDPDSSTSIDSQISSARSARSSYRARWRRDRHCETIPCVWRETPYPAPPRSRRWHANPASLHSVRSGARRHCFADAVAPQA